MAAQAGGKLDGTAVTIDEILKYRSQADCFKAVAVLDESHGGDGIVATDKINSIADLKGQTVAVNGGATSQFWVSHLLKKNGASLNDTSLSHMHAEDAAPRFIPGRVRVAG